MKYMLDTNICIYIIKKHPKAVLEKFKKSPLGEIGVSSITVAELMYGVQKSQHIQKNQQALEAFLAPLEIAAFDEITAAQYGLIRALLEKKGKVIGSLDLLIAAHAKSINAIVVTNNQKEFARVPELETENWVTGN